MIGSRSAAAVLVEVIDTSGAFIPGHGTPTVVLVGRNQPPAAKALRVVLGLRGEPGEPTNPAEGRVWSAITAQIDLPGSETRYVKSVDLDRKILASRPWTLGAGLDAKLAMERQSKSRLINSVVVVGRTAHTGADDAFFGPKGCWMRRGLGTASIRPVIGGLRLRDWQCSYDTETVFPYGGDLQPSSADVYLLRVLWANKCELKGRKELARGRRVSKQWFEFTRWHPERYRKALGVSFAEVATHNHFVLDKGGGSVHTQTAPVIRLADESTLEDHFGLVGALNSSMACFWLKQVCFPKGGSGIGRGIQAEDWMERYAFNSSNVEKFPLPPTMPTMRGRRLDELAQELTAHLPNALSDSVVPTRKALLTARTAFERVRGAMIAVQEELDWEVYRLYGIVDEELTYRGDDLPGLALGERAFEIVLAQRMHRHEEETAWFDRHGSTPTPEIPPQWPPAYRDLVQQRIEAIDGDPYLALIERPEFKRRWHPTFTTAWQDREKAALRDWLLNRLEDRALWFDGPADRPALRSAGQLADRLAFDSDFKNVLALYLDAPEFVLATEITALLEPESVPYLAALRYTAEGMRKRLRWEQAWDLQRRQEAGEDNIVVEVPPKYTSADFRGHYWSHRETFDVPKERFIAYPTAPRDGDPTPVYGWAGWDHAQQAFALAAAVIDRANAGWGAPALVPLLAGIAELEPWLHQWHGETDPAYGTSPAAYLSNFLRQRLADLSLTRADLTDWRPPAATRRRRRRRT